MKVMVGGTFDPLHDGHKQLLARSFDLATSHGVVIIGLTTDSFASAKCHPVRPYKEREKNLKAFIKSQGYTTTWHIETLSDRYGSALDADFDAIVVSEETLSAATEINRLRHEAGLHKVDIHQITCVLAEDRRWISSTRIYRGEIDEHGHLTGVKSIDTGT
jgi:pantetheine-phosphate adenylyltransferase